MKKLVFWALVLGIVTKETGVWLWNHVPDTGFLGAVKTHTVSAYQTVASWDKGDWTVVGVLAGLITAYSSYRKARGWWKNRGVVKGGKLQIRSADDAIRNSVANATYQLPAIIKRAMTLVAKAERKGFTKVSMDLSKVSPITRKLLVDGLVELKFNVPKAGLFTGENPSEYPDEVAFSFPLKAPQLAAAVAAPPPVKVAFGPPATAAPAVTAAGTAAPAAWWKASWSGLT